MRFLDPKAQPRKLLDTPALVELASAAGIKTCDRGSGSARMVYVDGDEAMAQMSALLHDWPIDIVALIHLLGEQKVSFRFSDDFKRIIVEAKSADRYRMLVFANVIEPCPSHVITEF